MADETPTPGAFDQATMGQITGTLRLVLASGGMWFVNHGYLDKGTETEIAGGIAAITVSFGWMFWARRKDGVIKAAARIAGVEKIVTDEQTANRIPSTKVVPPSVTVPTEY